MTGHTQPRFAPPSPPIQWFGRGGGGGGRGGIPWIVWVTLGLVLICSFVGLYWFGIGIVHRPLPTAAATVSAVAAWWICRHQELSNTRRFSLTITLQAIAGGVVGEVLHYVFVGIPPSVPPGVIWPVVGALGIGGGIGAGVGALALALWSGVLFLKIIRGWHAA